MNADEFARLKKIVLAAADLPATERKAYLDESCPDPTLRQEAEAMLAHDKGDTNTAAVDDRTSGDVTLTGTEEFPVELENTEIGPYRLIERVGEGGMGSVYLAEQQKPIRRRVALKVIKRGMDTKQVIARFEAERQALALMDHPNIAKIFDAGSTPRGRPYFVMEYVKGVPITTYCDKQKLTTSERLALFMQVCDGVQHAHQKAIIHRDLKPSNVLVTIENNKPVPKIIDFGVAKAIAQKLTESTVYTALGELIGTPEYMSPEQAEMTGEDVDTRTDVYSLGVVLYQLLAGGLPFEPEELREHGYQGIMQMIREKDPPRPSTKVSTLGERTTDVAAARHTLPGKLSSQLRGDLDWITMRALEKDRTRRYVSAAEFAADVRRHLRHEPVLASPPGAVYRVKKFVRRHRVGVVTGCVVAVSLIAAVVVSVLFALSEAQQRRLVAVERDRANAEANAAREVTEFLVRSFEAADPMEERADEITAREFLEGGVKRIDRELQDQPLLRARMLDAMGRAYQNLSLFDEAETLLEEALRLREAELGDWHADVAKSLSVLGALRNFQERWEEGRALEERALRIQQDLLGPDHVDTAWTLYALGSIEGQLGKFASAREHIESARAIFEEQLGPYSNAVAYCWQDLATGYGAMGDPETQLECFKNALEIKERNLPPDHPDVALSVAGVGLALAGMGQLPEATTYLERALEVYKKAFGEDHHRTAQCLHTLGYVLREQGRLDEAKIYYEQALSVYRHTTGEESYSVANLLDELGLLAYQAGNYAEADDLYRQAIPMMQKALGPNKLDRNFAGVLEHHAKVLRELNQIARATTLEARAKVIRQELELQRAQ